MNTFSRNIASEIKQMTGLDIEPVMELGIVKTEEARKWLVKEKYYQMTEKEKCIKVKEELSAKYGMSVSSIEKMIYRK